VNLATGDEYAFNLGPEHQAMLGLFATLDPRMRRLVMQHAIEVVESTGLDYRRAVEFLIGCAAIRLGDISDNATRS
jgi:hypothetical protein